MTDICPHPDFHAFVEIHRLFDVELTDDQALQRQPDSLSIDIRAECATCGEPVRFEGPIGADVGPGSQPKVSFDGLELRAPGHLGENRTRPVRTSFRIRE